MSIELGLRERKKQQTRQVIYDTASRLFARRGFDAVTVADVARAADVSDVTVFNYFPTKEDLFFGGMEFFEQRLLDAVRRRRPGESALTAFRRLILDNSTRLSDPQNGDVIAKSAALIAASPALQAGERRVVARFTLELATLLAKEVGADASDIEPLAAASAMMGVQRAGVAHTRAAVLAGLRGPKLASEFRTQAIRGFRLLEHGLGMYAKRDQ